MKVNSLLSGIPPMNRRIEDLELRVSSGRITLEGEEVYYQRETNDRDYQKMIVKNIISLMKDDGYSPSILNKVSLAFGYIPERMGLRKTA